MSTNKHIDKICALVTAFALVITVLFMCGEKLGIKAIETKKANYENQLFSTDKVHTLDITINDWDGFLSECENEEYEVCDIVIDGNAFNNVAIRAKGNTSLSQVKSYGNNRYSFKIEFDRFDSANSYFGLDKLSLNNIIQDNTYMKDYLTYTMMREMGVPSPLCSFVYITVNGSEWGLYLAVEGVEDAFLDRNYETDDANLYKPDSMDIGGGRGNGEKFNIDDFQDKQNNSADPNTSPRPSFGGEIPERGEMPTDESFDPSNIGDFGGGMGAFGGKSDVSLIYSDDSFDSYSNIFENAKTDITNTDKTRLIESIKKLNEQSDIEDVVNVNEVIKYFVVHNFVCNFDSYTGSMIHNYYLYENDGQLSMIPWDYNLAFGGFMGAQDATGLVNYPIDTPVSGGDIDSRPMLSWIFASEKYTELYHNLFSEFISKYFESGKFSEEFDRVTNLISPYIEKDPTKFCTYDEFKTGISTLKEFCTLRAESVSLQLDGTIPSTDEGQKENKENMVDASHIQIKDMGSMGNMGGGFEGNPNGNQNKPNSNEGEGQIPDSPPNGFSGMQPPNGNFEMPENFDPSQFGGGPPEGMRPSF